MKRLFIILSIANTAFFGIILPLLGKYVDHRLDISLQEYVLFGAAIQVLILSLQIELVKLASEEQEARFAPLLTNALRTSQEAYGIANSLSESIRDIRLTSRDSFKAARVTVAVFNKFLHYMPLYIAEDMGFFAEEGLTVEIIPKGNDDLALFALSTTECDFAITDPMMIFLPGVSGGGSRCQTVASSRPFLSA
jgi:hypothetical protein